MQDDKISDKVGDAVASGMEAYLETEARGAPEAPEEEALAAAFGRSVERYLDSLEDGQRTRVLVGLLRPGTVVPEENMLAGLDDGDNPGEESTEEDARRREHVRQSVLKAAVALAETGEIKRVRSRKDGRIYWMRL